jgi:hypothetical protein
MSDFTPLAKMLGNRRKGCERRIDRFAPFVHSNMPTSIHSTQRAAAMRRVYEGSATRGGGWNAPHSRLARAERFVGQGQFFFHTRGNILAWRVGWLLGRRCAAVPRIATVLDAEGRPATPSDTRDTAAT